MRGLPVPAETPPALCSCCLGVGRRGVCHSKLGFLGSWLTCPPPFAPTQPLLAWMEARVRMEVAAPSCPPGRLPACECLALSHEWALCGGGGLSSLPASVHHGCLYHYLRVCGSGNLLFPVRISSVETRGSGVCLARVQIPCHIAD